MPVERSWLSNLRAGDGIEARNAFGDWIPGVAASDLEGTHRDGRKVHEFPVVWVKLAGRAEPLPWPAEDIRPPRPQEYRADDATETADAQ